MTTLISGEEAICCPSSLRYQATHPIPSLSLSNSLSPSSFLLQQVSATKAGGERCPLSALLLLRFPSFWLLSVTCLVSCHSVVLFFCQGEKKKGNSCWPALSAVPIGSFSSRIFIAFPSSGVYPGLTYLLLCLASCPNIFSIYLSLQVFCFTLVGESGGGHTMSLATGARSSCSKEMDDLDEGAVVEEEEEEEEKGRRAGEEDEEDDEKHIKRLDLGPQFTLKQQLDKDKEDESLRRWKEQLLGCVDLDSVGEHLEAEVKILGLSILSPGRPDIDLKFPVAPKSKGPWFTLKEGSSYKLKFSFFVNNNIVSGLRYTNTVWRAGIKVDSTKEMLGTFSPQLEPYIYEMHEGTTPSGIFARGSYSARSRFIDDDGNCYLEINYTFDIRKEWASRSK